MFSFDEKFRFIVVLGILIGVAIGSPMYYKKMDGDTYEPDLIPVSSTVIPLISYQLNSTGDASVHHALSLNDEYRIAYLNHVHNKTKKQNLDDPDTLITLTKKYHPDKHIKVPNNGMAKVKPITVSNE